MGLLEKFAIGVLAISAAILVQLVQDLTKAADKPHLELDAYWGPKDKSLYKEDTTIRSLNISYSDVIIDKLKHKLVHSGVLPESIEGSNFEYGFNSHEMTKLIKYWKDTYLNEWRERENYLNQFKHFKTNIQGLNIHYIRAKPKHHSHGVKVHPILLLHGWPGSVREFYELIPKLIEKSPDTEFVFEVIAPSLPGFGWSQGASKSGFGSTEMAIVLRNLMIRLGHQKFFIHGGSWGSVIGSNIAALFPENVLGFHSNQCVVNTGLAFAKQAMVAFLPKKHFLDRTYLTWFYPLRPKFKYLLQESGYIHIQSTKPDTIGMALSSNPVGLAAYILEKFATWTDPNNTNKSDGGLYENFEIDDLLDNVMIYYLSNSITTSLRTYYESLTDKEWSYQIERIPVKAPVACARFKNDLIHLVDWALKDKYPKLIQTNFYEDGGNFAALQFPDVLHGDIVQFIKRVKV